LDFLQNHVEALIFCSPNPIKIKDLKACLTEMFEADVPEKDLDKCIENLQKKYNAQSHSFQVYKIGGGYQFMTKPEYQASIGILLKHQSKRRLSTSALETIAIIAYKQPITKPEVERIRGVNCDYSIQRLLDKGLIEIKGKSDRIGRPLIYGTSDDFMDYFGINNIDELPTTEDFEDIENRIGIEKE